MQLGLWQIIASTDLITKGIMVLLLGMSILCWALFFYKRSIMATKIKSLKQAKGLLQNTKNVDDFIARLSVIQHTYAGELINQFLGDFKKLLRMYEMNGSQLSDKDWYLLQSNINQRVDEAIAEEEFLIPILSTSAQASPLIGLFGTVYGLIHAFMGIAATRSADISAVAPGIAEALLTTMGGLVVAIPSLVLFNYLQSSMRSFESEVVEVADTCLWSMRGFIASSEAVHTSPSVAPFVQESIIQQ